MKSNFLLQQSCKCPIIRPIPGQKESVIDVHFSFTSNSYLMLPHSLCCLEEEMELSRSSDFMDAEIKKRYGKLVLYMISAAILETWKKKTIPTVVVVSCEQ